jgi:hypothetical protein
MDDGSHVTFCTCGTGPPLFDLIIDQCYLLVRVGCEYTMNHEAFGMCINGLHDYLKQYDEGRYYDAFGKGNEAFLARMKGQR